MRMQRWIVLTLGVVLCMAYSVSAAQSGLKTNYTKFIADNLPIGHTLSMKKIANAPMMVGNNYDAPIVITIEPQIPKKLQPGYEAIPDPAWIRIETTSVTVPANSKVDLDVLVSIPDDPKYFGKKFQCDLGISTPGEKETKGMFHYGFQITGIFLFSVAPGRNEDALASAMKSPANADYSITPPQVVLWNVKAGQTVEVKSQENKWLELANNSKKKQTYWLSSVNPADTGFTVFEGSHFSGNADDVIVPQDEITLRAGAKKALELKIKVPQNADFSSGPLVYLVTVKTGKSQGGVSRYIAVYLYDTEKIKTPLEPEKK